ncbi:hypothetical protein HO133_010590 [Letharia lupina]|uniref:Uncharacterized protein n=1 Tax=Letharia lupina TaxID=560253 RepID=A0A8H6FDF8_9LECA|nr:uncharacterized protein HO133_010590 [Letharia lupina]KAF6224016.1 hypothetical protein HO133_010590 [Letharia lupina]
MVLQALAALSLAKSVINVVDFAAEVISKGNEYCKSSEGILPENTELQAITDNFARLNKGLRGPRIALKTAAEQPDEKGALQLSKDEKVLQLVAQKCEAIAIGLATALDRLRKALGQIIHLSAILDKAPRSARHEFLEEWQVKYQGEVMRGSGKLPETASDDKYQRIKNLMYTA